MSGGKYNHAHMHVEQFVIDLDPEGQEHAASPRLRRAFANHLVDVAMAMKACEWNDSYDGDDCETALIRRVLGMKNGKRTVAKK